MGDDFQTTSWGLILAVGDPDTARSRLALTALCEAYWQPLYAYVRRRGYEPQDARDLTQAYFAHLLEKQTLEHVTPGGGRFRAFLLVSLKNLLAEERDKGLALKRGGGRTPIPLDLDTAERGYPVNASHALTPEVVFEKRWAATVLQRVLDRLRGDFTRAGKPRHFELLKTFLMGDEPSPSYRQVADDLEMTEDAVKMAVHRLRKQFGKALRLEIAQTVADPAEVDDEVRHLLSVLEA